MQIGRFFSHGARLTPLSDGHVPIGVQTSGAPALWRRGITGEGRVAAVIDSGVDADHPDLAERIVDYIDLTGEGRQDDLGHGTHVAGTICACGRISGVAPGASLLVIKVIGRTASCDEGLVAQAIRLAVDWRGPRGERAAAINISLGGPGDSPELHGAICYAVAQNVEPVCAAGNDGNSRDGAPLPTYPAAYREAVEVGAVRADRTSSTLFSSSESIDLCAVGESVDSTWPLRLGTPYACLSGTSMAAAHITGLLLLEDQMWEVMNGRSFRDEAERWRFAAINVVPLDLPPKQQGLGLGFARVELLPTEALCHSVGRRFRR